MEDHFFIKGIILGFSIAAPVGPIGILCIRKTLQYGRLSGLFSGLGAAVADTLYGVIAAFGLTALSNILFSGKFWLQLVGGCFLIYLGIKTYSSKPGHESKEISHKTLLSDFASTFFLTLTNPMTIFSYLAIFAGVGLSTATEHPIHATYLVAGVFLGSALWWLILSEGITLFRKRISKKFTIWTNRGAGIMIGIFGMLALISTFFTYV
jgi:threonine/homoserine/homoserine lactone efflux protein